MIIGTVVEGPTDHIFLEGILKHMFVEARVRNLHPREPFGEMGPGWRGVKKWCQLNGHRLGQIISGDSTAPLELLVIQIDADIARQRDLQQGQDDDSLIHDVLQPCPPITSTVEKLTQVLLTWLDYETMAQLPPQVVFAIPPQDMESWVFASLFPDDPLCQRDDYECIHNNQLQYPAHLLTTKAYWLSNKDKLIRYKDGKLKKNTRLYQKSQPTFATGWTHCCNICTQAKAFHERLVHEHVN